MQPSDPQTDLGEHAPHLVKAAFGKVEFRLVRAKYFQSSWPAWPILPRQRELSRRESFDQIGMQFSFHRGVVCFADVESRTGPSVDPLTDVSQQEKSGSVAVEASHRAHRRIPSRPAC